MTYEMIFGDERLADKFTNENSVFIVYRGHGVYFEFESGNDGVNYIANSCSIGDSFYMRRIIKEPKRWTWEDKKAGRLPEVGAKCRQDHKDEIVVAVTEKFVVTECQDMSVCTTRKDVFMRSYNPIETPAEKAQREEDEFVEELASGVSRYDRFISGVSRYDSFINGARAAYSKLKGGE